MNIKELIDKKEIDTRHDIACIIKEVYRTPQGFYLITVSDGSGTIKLTTAKHELAQSLQAGEVHSFGFTTKIYNDKLQGDLQQVSAVSDEVKEQIITAQVKGNLEKYKPKDEKLLIHTEHFEQLRSSMIDVAAQVRAAVIEQRPVHISHHNDCDGYSSGILLERSIRALVQRYHPHEKYVNQYISRFPSRTPYYDLIDATRDVGFFLNDADRFNMKAPLIIIVDNGSTKQDLLSIEKVKMYGADVVVVDHHDPGELDEQGKSLICKHVLAHVNPHLQGIKEGFSASMLAYQVCHYINRHDAPSVFVAALGGVADRCEGKEIDLMISETKKEREELWKVSTYVDYEIFMTKTNSNFGGIFTLLYGTDKERSKLIALYEPVKKEAEVGVKASIQKYVDVQQWGQHKVALLNGEQTALWSDYYSIGKLAGITHDLIQPTLTIVHTDAIMVFRAEKGSFDVNGLLKQLQPLVHARISGGGHAVAGSIKFISAAKQEILDFIKKSLETQ